MRHTVLRGIAGGWLTLLTSAAILPGQDPAPVAGPGQAAAALQTGDTTFAFTVPHPAFPLRKGPLVLVDEGHFNFHTIDGRFAPFASLLALDGFVLRGLAGSVTSRALDSAAILVVANALSERNTHGNWSLPTPSAFSVSEIGVIRHWVAGGGSLFLIADHMPFPGAAADLAAAFGVTLINGFAADREANPANFVFHRSDGTLGRHPITEGRNPWERIDSVRTFAGQALRVGPQHRGLLALDSSGVVLLPRVAWAFDERTPRISSAGMWQGAVLQYGKGRVAVFGEAAMFTAQVAGAAHVPVGMNQPEAPQNAQFLLNVIHWLAGVLPAA